MIDEVTKLHRGINLVNIVRTSLNHLCCVYSFRRCHLFLLFLMEIDTTMAMLPAAFDCQCQDADNALTVSTVLEQWLSATHFDSTSSSINAMRVSRIPSLDNAIVDTNAMHTSVWGSSRTGRSASVTSPPSPSAATGLDSGPGLASAGTADGESDSSRTRRDGLTDVSWMNSRGHLMLVLPLAVRLTSCSHSQLRNTAGEIVRWD